MTGSISPEVRRQEGWVCTRCGWWLRRMVANAWSNPHLTTPEPRECGEYACVDQSKRWKLPSSVVPVWVTIEGRTE